MNIAEWLFRTARVCPHAPALMTGMAVEADYRTFACRAAGLGAAFQQRFGIGPGDRVAVLMKNRTEYLEALYGIWWIGAAAVPINAKLHAREVATILADSGAGLVLSDDQSTPTIADPAGPPILSADDPSWQRLAGSKGEQQPLPMPEGALAWLFYTSGTTGRPKGVMLTHSNLVAASLCYPVDVDPVTAADAALYAAPMSHGAGLYNFIHVRAGARHVVPPSGGFDPDEILDLSPRLRHVSFFAAPTMVRRLVETARRRGSHGEGIRTIVYGGGPMYQADIEEAVRVMGSRFVQIYGQGESPMTITALSREHVADRSSPSWRSRLGSVGVAQSCVEIRIADSTGAFLASGEVGEVLVAGPQVMAGYWNDDAATAQTLRQGWLWTGDLGRLDEAGFLTLTDRSKDLVISGGSNIYPREVEEALLTHPGIVEASVVGRRHEEWGEEVVAFVVARDGIAVSRDELERHCLERIARFKRPKHYFFVDELPKNNYGKVLKTELRHRLNGG